MKKLSIFILICLVSTLGGCAGYREIDKGYLVTAVGFLNKNDSARVFVEAISSSDVASTDSERVVLSGSGNNTQQAYDKLKATLTKPLYFEQLGTAVFEGDIDENLNFLKRITNINYGIYLVKTDDAKALFENETTNGVLGYDIISFIKTQQKQSETKVSTQIFSFQNDKEVLPTVNFVDGNLVLKVAGENK